MLNQPTLIKSTMSLWHSIQEVDDGLSNAVFSMTLPPVLETLLSVPGNIFGIIPCLVLCPMWLAIYLQISTIGETPIALLTITIAFTAAFLVVWFVLLRRDSQVLLHLAVPKGYVVAAYFTLPLCLALTSHYPSFSLAMYPFSTWAPTMVVCLLMKNKILRHRPCFKYPHLIQRKSLRAIPDMLAKHGSEASFPSGDAAGSVCFAIPLFAAGHTSLAAATVFLSCFGRMYFLAHHLLDVTAGALLPFIFHMIYTSIFGVDIANMSWWLPLALHTAAFAVAFAIPRSHTKQR